MHDERHWLLARERMSLEPGVAYLNAGSFSPVPRPVADALAVLRDRLASEPMDFHIRQAPFRLQEARRRLAECLDASPSNLLLLPNVTFAINLAVAALDFPAGAEIILTDHEYGAMEHCWRRRAAELGWRLRVATLPFGARAPADIVAAFAEQASPQTRAVFFSHVTSPTGYALPADDICRWARERGLISVVDGAHAAGMLPVSLEAIGADFYGGNCHKWLMAPAGAGFLHVRDDHRRSLRPLIVSWGWNYDPADADVDSQWGGSFWARNLEFMGTIDRCPQMVLPTALDFRSTLGESAIADRVRELSTYARLRLSEIGLEPALAPEWTRAMTPFNVPTVDVIKARDGLWNGWRIAAPFTQAAGRNFLRVSTAWFNTRDDIDRLAVSLRSAPWDDWR